MPYHSVETGQKQGRADTATPSIFGNTHRTKKVLPGAFVACEADDGTLFEDALRKYCGGEQDPKTVARL